MTSSSEGKKFDRLNLSANSWIYFWPIVFSINFQSAKEYLRSRNLFRPSHVGFLFFFLFYDFPSKNALIRLSGKRRVPHKNGCAITDGNVNKSWKTICWQKSSPNGFSWLSYFWPIEQTFEIGTRKQEFFHSSLFPMWMLVGGEVTNATVLQRIALPNGFQVYGLKN